MSQTLVLGWDALDHELIRAYGLEEQFGTYSHRIDTHVDPATGEPHTTELWPSLITGVPPTEHGIRAHSDDSGVEWESDWLTHLSRVADGIVPQPIRNRVGATLRDSGARLEAKGPDYYADRGLPTVFDGLQSRAISIPNYETWFDRKHGLDAMRSDLWNRLLVDRDGSEGYKPTLSLEEMYHLIGGAVGERVGHTLGAAQRDYALVWTWFGVLDTVGHLAPAIDEPIQEDWYELAAAVTAGLRTDDTTVVAVSDHGLQHGQHTHYATIASDDPSIRDVESIYDVRAWIESQADKTDSQGGAAVDATGMAAVRDQLDNLGYLG